MGFIVAAPSGVAVILAVSKGGFNAIVGTAISASLLPPIVNSGLCLALGIQFSTNDISSDNNLGHKYLQFAGVLLHNFSFLTLFSIPSSFGLSILLSLCWLDFSLFGDFFSLLLLITHLTCNSYVKDVTPPLSRPLIQTTQSDTTVSVSESTSPIQGQKTDDQTGQSQSSEIEDFADHSDWRKSVHTSIQGGDMSSYLKPNYSTEKLLSMNVGNEGNGMKEC
jgi:hypothetical protein